MNQLISFILKFYFLSPAGPSCHVVEKHQCTLAPVNHMVIVQCLPRISGDSVLANNDCRYLLSPTVWHSYQLFELFGEL